MKKLLFFAGFLFSWILGLAQNDQRLPAYGYEMDRLRVLNSLQIPQFTDPKTARKDSIRAQIGYKVGDYSALWIYSPETLDWYRITGVSGAGSVDSIHLSNDSLYYFAAGTPYYVGSILQRFGFPGQDTIAVTDRLFDLQTKTLTIHKGDRSTFRVDTTRRLQFEEITALTSDEDDFEIILIPDTQNMVDSAISFGFTHGRSIFQWIKDSATTRNIKVAIGLGDITNESTTIQRDTADKWYDLLDDADIPYVPTIGNHDYNGNLPATRNASNYLSTFGPTRISGKSWYGGNYSPAPENFFINFDGWGRPFSILSLEYWPRDSTLAWADSLLDANPERTWIYVTHAYLNSFGERSADTSLWGNNVTGQGADNSGSEQWDKFVKRHKNISFTFNGHFLGPTGTEKTGLTRYFDDVGDYGNVIHQFFVNYQTDTAGGNGWFVRLQVKPRQNKIYVRYYSAYLDRYDTRVDSLTYNFPTLTVSTDKGIQGSLSVRGPVRIDGPLSTPLLGKFQVPFIYEGNRFRGGDSILYNPVTGEFRVNTPTDLGAYRTQLTGDLINKTGSILIDGGNVTTKSTTGVQNGFIGQGYAGDISSWELGGSSINPNGAKLYLKTSSGSHGNIGAATYDAEKTIQIGMSDESPMVTFFNDSKYLFIHGGAGNHYYRPTGAMVSIAGKDSATGSALNVTAYSPLAPAGSSFPSVFQVANNGTSTFWNTDIYTTTQGKTKAIFRNGYRQGTDPLLEVRGWDDSLNVYIDSSGLIVTKRRLYISPTRTVPTLAANLHVVHPTSNFGIVITRAVNDNGGANLTYFKTRSADPTVNVAAQAGDWIHNNYFYTVSGNGTRVLSHERNSFVKVVGTSFVSGYWRWAGYNESGSYINQMYLMPDGAISIGVNPSFPDTSAILDLQSTIKAFYPPRMTGAEMNAIPGVDAGAIVYCTDSSAHCYFNGSVWLKFGTGTGGGGGVTSVALSMPSAFSVTGSPITSSGTLSVTAAGTSDQYIDGTGALQTSGEIELETDLGVPLGAFRGANTLIKAIRGPGIISFTAVGDSLVDGDCPTCITSSGNLTNNYLLIGQGSRNIQHTTTGTGVLTALGVNVGTDGAFITRGGSAGTPSGITLTNGTGLPVTSGLTAGNWKLFYSNGSGALQELALGANGTVLTSNGASSGPSFTSATTYTASNGLTMSSNNVKLGGVLGENTTIGLDGFTIGIPDLQNFADTTNWKPMVTNTTGTGGSVGEIRKATYWPTGSGGGGSYTGSKSVLLTGSNFTLWRDSSESELHGAKVYAFDPDSIATGRAKGWMNAMRIKLTTPATGDRLQLRMSDSSLVNYTPNYTISPSQITSDQDNYSPTGWDDAEIVRLDGDATIRAITSFAAPTAAGKPIVKTLINVGSYPIYLPSEHPDGTAANRISYFQDFILYPKQSVDIIYMSASSRWRIKGENNIWVKRGVSYSISAGSITAGDHGELGFAQTGTSAAAAATASTTSLPAAWSLGTGTTAAGLASVYMGKSVNTISAFASAHQYAEATVSIPTLSNGTQTFFSYLLITNSPNGTTAEPNNSVFIRYNEAVNSGKWQLVSQDNAGTESTADLGITVAAATLYTLRIEIDKAKSEARAYIDGTFAGRVTGNMPNSVVSGPKVTIAKTVGTTASTMLVHSFSAGAIY